MTRIVRIARPVETSQRRSVLSFSAPADARIFPSGLKATTCYLHPLSVQRRQPTPVERIPKRNLFVRAACRKHSAIRTEVEARDATVVRLESSQHVAVLRVPQADTPVSQPRGEDPTRRIKP